MSDSVHPTSAHVGQSCTGLTGKALPGLPGPPSHIPTHPDGTKGLPGSGDSRTDPKAPRELLLSTQRTGRETQRCPNSRPFQGTRYPHLHLLLCCEQGGTTSPLTGSQLGWVVQERQE